MEIKTQVYLSSKDVEIAVCAYINKRGYKVESNVSFVIDNNKLLHAEAIARPKPPDEVEEIGEYCCNDCADYGCDECT